MQCRCSLAVLALAMVATIAARAGTGGPEVNIPFEKLTLSNGMQVILAEDRRLPLVATNLRFHVGSANDPPGREGFAHLFEHLYAFSPPESIPSPQSLGATQDSDEHRASVYIWLANGLLPDAAEDDQLHDRR